MLRGFRYRLAPTAEQEELFRQFAGVCRLVYNLGLEQRRDWYRQYKANTGRNLVYVSQARELTALRASFDWIAAVSQTCQQQALRDLDVAFANFFKGRASYPTPRKKDGANTFRFQGREIEIRKLNARWSAVRFPKIGWVKFRDTRAVGGLVKRATVSSSANGWHVAFSAEIERAAPLPNRRPSVGVDRGVTNAIALSTGERFSAPEAFGIIERRRRAAQRVLSRRKRGSKRYAKQRRRIAILHARAGRIRSDWLHRISTNIARRFSEVVLEDLKIPSMTATARGTLDAPGRNVRQKAGLNRAILEQGWSIFATLLAYKMEERGGQVARVNPAYTSQTCSDCGIIDSESRESQAAFVCRHCGFRAHADTNAAVNIERRWNTPLLDVEGLHQRPREASTGRAVTCSENPALSGAGGC